MILMDEETRSPGDSAYEPLSFSVDLFSDEEADPILPGSFVAKDPTTSTPGVFVAKTREKTSAKFDCHEPYTRERTA